MASARAKWAGFTDEQARQLDALVERFNVALRELRAPDRVLDRRGSALAVRPRPGDVVRAQAGDVIVLPHPRAARGREPIVVLVESQPVTITADGGTVNDAETITVTTVGAMSWYATGSEWWGSAVGGSAGGGGSSFTPTFATPVDVGLTNTEGVSTDFARADHVHRDRIGTGTDDGYLSRTIYVHASSASLGISNSGTTTIAAVTWNDETDIPDGNWFRIVLVATGGSGSAGLIGHTTAGHGGTGGGGAAWRMLVLSRAELVAMLPITIAPGLEVAGGSATTTTTGTTTGNAGANGNVTSFGPYTIYPGGGANTVASGSACPGGGGGGWLSAGQGAQNSATGNFGGDPLPGQSVVGSAGDTTATYRLNSHSSTYGGGSCSPPSLTTTGTSGGSVFGGGAGGGSGTSAAASRPGGNCVHGAGGGGGAPFANGTGTPTGTPQPGGSSGRAAGGAAGSNGSNTATDGQPGDDTPDLWQGAGGGGGAGGSAAAASGAVTAGNGGAGGFPGGGGGGGGTAVSANTVNATNGAGGLSGAGAVGVEAWA